jgi:hypothetical protein
LTSRWAPGLDLHVRSFALWLLAALLVVPAGCRAKSDRKPVFPVRGKVLYQGQPASGARVGFVSLDDPLALKPQGQVAADGTFQLSTYELDDGAPAGHYVVTITWPGPNPRSNGEGDEETQGPDRFRRRYSNAQTSAWKIEVTGQPQELEPFKLD